MPYPPKAQLCRRAPRVGLHGNTPVVLRHRDGHRTAGQLHVLSLTGGLVSLAGPLDAGARVKIMFLSDEGSVLGEVEMLPPLAWERQAFKFTALCDDDRVRLGRVIESRLTEIQRQEVVRNREHDQVEQFRAW